MGTPAEPEYMHIYNIIIYVFAKMPAEAAARFFGITAHADLTGLAAAARHSETLARAQVAGWRQAPGAILRRRASATKDRKNHSVFY
jgi:hypothetical protein